MRFLLSPLFVLLLLTLIGLGLWSVVSGLRLNQASPKAPVSPQELGALAQPYRRLLGEAVATEQDVQRQIETAPRAFRRSLQDIGARMHSMTRRALPRAQHGTRLTSYLLRLEPGEAQYRETKRAAQQVEDELEEFVATLNTLRAKVYQVLTDASRLALDDPLSDDLSDAMIEAEALVEAFGVWRE